MNPTIKIENQNLLRAKTVIKEIVEIVDAYQTAIANGEAKYHGKTINPNDAEDIIKKSIQKIDATTQDPKTGNRIIIFTPKRPDGKSTTRLLLQLDQGGQPKGIKVEYVESENQWGSFKKIEDELMPQLLLYMKLAI